jgi:hypothetical protein
MFLAQENAIFIHDYFFFKFTTTRLSYLVFVHSNSILVFLRIVDILFNL